MSAHYRSADVVLIGTGIMSATVGMFLRYLQPEWSITMLERLDSPAQESTNAFNNSGTGHAGFCELFYTPTDPTGKIDLAKAIHINEQFHLSRQLWAFASQEGLLRPQEFIHPSRHASFVTGQDRCAYLQRRYEHLHPHPLFDHLHFSDDPEEIRHYFPLLVTNRPTDQPMALSWSNQGTEIDFASLTRQLLHYATTRGTHIAFGHHVKKIWRDRREWVLETIHHPTGKPAHLRARFVFIGAGGFTLSLLANTGLIQPGQFQGVPISGCFLQCLNPQLTHAHQGKVYGLPPQGAPATTAAHLDHRLIDNHPYLFFGPFPGKTLKLLKHGTSIDFLKSLRADDLIPLASVTYHERHLVGYLLSRALWNNHQRVNELRDFIPTASECDWGLRVAGQRVQMIHQGHLEFTTRLVSSADGTLAALLGASPGASVSVSIALETLQRCFPSYQHRWAPQLHDMIPSLGQPLATTPDLYQKIQTWTDEQLHLLCHD